MEFCVGGLSLTLKHLFTPEIIQQRLLCSTFKAVEDLENDAECRVCLEKTRTEENPMIAPCECTGSIGPIHKHCLDKWIFGINPLFIDGIQCLFLNANHTSCELCHYSYEPYIENFLARLVSVCVSSNFGVFQYRTVMHKETEKEEKQKYLIYKFDSRTINMKIGTSEDLCEFTWVDHLMSEVNTMISFN
jgi:hypothetical protein